MQTPDRVFGEQMHVSGQLDARPGGTGGIEIVVAGGDEHGRVHARKAAAEFLAGLVVARVAVQKVAG